MCSCCAFVACFPLCPRTTQQQITERLANSQCSKSDSKPMETKSVSIGQKDDLHMILLHTTAEFLSMTPG